MVIFFIGYFETMLLAIGGDQSFREHPHTIRFATIKRLNNMRIMIIAKAYKFVTPTLIII